MKKKIYILPSSPSEVEFRTQLSSINPPIAPRIYEQLVVSFTMIQDRIRNAALNDVKHHVHQTQTISDGTHTVVLVGQLDSPSLMQRVMDIF